MVHAVQDTSPQVGPAQEETKSGTPHSQVWDSAGVKLGVCCKCAHVSDVNVMTNCATQPIFINMAAKSPHEDGATKLVIGVWMSRNRQEHGVG